MKKLFSCSGLLCVLVAAGSANLFAQTVNVDKPSLTFSALSGGTAVSTTLTLTSTGAPVTFSIFSNATWLKVNAQAAASGTTPSTVTVSADPTSLPPGTISSSLSIFGGAGTVSVPVSFTVSTIGVNPSAIQFPSYIVGSTNMPAAQTITLSGPATTFSTAATTATGGNWLVAIPATGNVTGGTVTALLNPAVVPGLAVGTYLGTIAITPTGGASAPAVAVPVTLIVSSAPVITYNPSSLQFNLQTAQSGATNNITQQTVTISTTPGTPQNYGCTSTASWIVVNPCTGNFDTPTGTAQVVIMINPAGLTPATYNAIVTFITPGGSPSQKDIPVTLLLSNTALLNVPTNALNFTYQLGLTPPADQTVNITSTSGVQAFFVTASANAPWLTVPASGTTGVPIIVKVSKEGLLPGTYTAVITITGTPAGSVPQQIPVTFKVTNDPLLSPISPLVFPFQIGQSAPPSQSVKIGSTTGASLNYSATISTTTCGANWLLLNGSTTLPATGATGGSLVLSVNPAGQPAGTCTGAISIAATIPATGAPAINSPLVVPVTMYVSTGAQLTISPNTPAAFTVPFGSQAPAPLTYVLGSTSSTDQLSYTVTVPTPADGPWLLASPQIGNTTAPSNTLIITVAPAALAVGTYTGKIVVTATGPNSAPVADSPFTIPVTLTVTAGTVTLSSTSLAFTQTSGGPVPASLTVTIGGSGPPLNYTAIASNSPGLEWLSVSPTSGTTSVNSTLTVSVDGKKLTPGTYNGTITVTAPGASNSPATIGVSFTLTAGVLSVPPNTSLSFTQLLGGAAPAALPVVVSGTPGVLNFTAAPAANAPWLSVSPTSGSTPATLQVTVNGAGLAVGQYTSSVILTSGSSTVTVPVVLNIVSAQTLSTSPSALSFAYTLGLTNPSPQSLVVNSTGGAAPFTVQVQNTASVAWLQVTPTSGTAPATLTVTAQPGSLPAGTYTAKILISSSSAINPVSVDATLTVAQIPKPVVTAIGNAASYSTGSISPGENIVLFGTGIGPATLVGGSVANNTFATTAGTTRVLFDGVAAPVIYASERQTSVMVPYGVNGRTTTSVVVEYSGVQSNPLSYNVVAASPGIYTLNVSGNGPGAILNQNGTTVNGPATPAPRGSVISVYMTGEGQTDPIGVDGLVIAPQLSALKRPLLGVTATIGGIKADVQYAGSAAGLVSGVMQVNLLVPDGAPTGGAVPILITVGTAQTQAGVTVSVQ